MLVFWFIGTDEVSAQPEDGEIFSLSCRSANLRDVLAQLAIQKDINIADLDSIDKGLIVTTHLSAVPFEAGLHALLGPKGFTFEKRGDIYFIVKPPPAHTRLSLNISDDNLSINASGTDVNSVIGALAKAGISITSATSLTGTIAAHLTEQPIDKALPILFADFTLHQADGIYRITERPSPIAGGSSTLLIHGGLISLWARDTALTDLLAELAERLNINLSVVGEIDRQVTVRIENKPLSDLLYSLAQMTGYSYHTVEDLHFFGKASLTPDETNPLLQRKTIWLKHLKAKEVLNLLPVDIPKQHVTVSETHNTVTVVGSGELIASTEQFLSLMDIDSDTIRSRQPKGTIAIAQARETFRLTVDLKNAPLFDVIRQLSIETGIDVIFLDAEDAAGVELVYLTPQPVLLANRLIAEYGGAERVCGVHVDGDRCDLAVVEGAEVYGGRSFEIEDPAHLWESVRQTVDNCPNPNGMPMTRLVLFQAYSQNRERASPLSVPTGVFDCEVTAATFDWAEVLIAPIENSDGIGLNLLKPLLLKQRRHRKQLAKRWLWRGLPIAVGLLLLLANLYLFNVAEGEQYRIDQLRDVQVKSKQLQTKTESLTTEHRVIEEALTQLAWGERRYPPLAKRLVQIAECIPATVQLTEIHTLPPPRKPSSSFDTHQTLRLIGLAKVQSEIDAFRIALLTQIEFSVVKQVKTEPTLIKGERGLEFTLLLISVEG